MTDKIYCANCFEAKYKKEIKRKGSGAYALLRHKVICKKGQWDNERGHIAYSTIWGKTMPFCIYYQSMGEPGENIQDYLDSLPESKEDIANG